jgi:pyridoxine kinase
MAALVARLPNAGRGALTVIVLSIQSQVVWGHVGNSAAAFALQRLGIDVLAVPTALFSHHRGHAASAGRVLPADQIATLIQGVKSRDFYRDCAGVLTGWMGGLAAAEVARRAALEVKSANPKALWLCDPVLGDREKGVYVAPELVDFYRRAIAEADIVTPNRFELEVLTGRTIGCETDALAALDQILAQGPRMALCTGLEIAEGEIATLMASADSAFAALTPKLARAEIDCGAKGAGDLLAALLLGRLCLGASVEDALKLSVGAVFDVLQLSQEANSAELALIAGQDALVTPRTNPIIRRLR